MILFKSIDIDLDYTSFAKGIVTERGGNKKTIILLEEIIEFIFIKNLSSDSTNFRTKVK